MHEFASGPSGSEIEHLFTNGSCFAQGRPEIHTAAWAVYNASSHQPIGAGPLSGLLQTIGRGELLALVHALRWTLLHRVRTHVWLDALHVHDGYQQRRVSHLRHQDCAHADLWLEVEHLLDEGVGDLANSSWIPSHLDPTLCENPFEDWVARHNAAVDTLVVRCNADRPASFWHLVEQQRQWDLLWRARLHRLRQYYFQIYEDTHVSSREPEVICVESSADEEDVGSLYSFADLLSDPSQFCTFPEQTGIPLSFLHGLITWINDHDAVDCVPCACSFLEITVGMMRIDPVQFPFRDPASGAWTDQARVSLFERPTLAYYLDIVQKTFQFLAQQIHLADPVLRNINCLSLGVHPPQKGIFLRLTPSLRTDIKEMLGSFTRRRPIRRCADLARPMA